MVLFGRGMRGFFSFFGYNEIRSMSGRYASYWNAFLFNLKFSVVEIQNIIDKHIDSTVKVILHNV